MLILDMDGTMTDSNGIWKQVDIDFLKKRGMEYTREYYEGVGHTILPLAAKFTKEFCHLEESEEDIVQEWLQASDDLYEHVQLKPYVKEFLDQEKRKGTRMVVLTSSVPHHAKTALNNHNLFPYFDRVFYAVEMGIDKKSPDIFLKVLEETGEKAEDCTLLDDSILSCENAKKVGMKAIGVYDDYFHVHEEQMKALCDKYIYSFEDLLDK